MKKASKKAMKGLGGTAFTLPSDSPMVAICKQLSDVISEGSSGIPVVDTRSSVVAKEINSLG